MTDEEKNATDEKGSESTTTGDTPRHTQPADPQDISRTGDEGVRPPPPPPAQPQEPFIHGVLRAMDDASSRALKYFRNLMTHLGDQLSHIAANPMALAHGFESLFEKYRCVVPETVFPAFASRAQRAGQLALLSGAILSVLFGICAALCLRNWTYLVVGAAFAFIFPPLQIAASRSLDALGSAPLTPRGTPVSARMLDTLAYLAEAAGLLFLAASLVASHAWRSPALAFIGMAWWGLLDTLCYLLMHPTLAGVRTTDRSQDSFASLGAMPALGNAMLHAVPTVFGIGAAVCAVGAFTGILSLLAGGTAGGAIACLAHLAVFGAIPLLGWITRDLLIPGNKETHG